jgi:hypothetical protein
LEQSRRLLRRWLIVVGRVLALLWGSLRRARDRTPGRVLLVGSRSGRCLWGRRILLRRVLWILL